MIEEQLRDGLRAAVTQEPPLGFNPDEVADNARRAAHRRRTAWATGAVAVIVAAGAIGTVAAFGRAGGPTVEPAHRGGMTEEVSSPGGSMLELGSSLAQALSSVEPKARNIEVFAEADNLYGVVLYEVGGQPAALAFHVEDCAPIASGEGCDGALQTGHMRASDGSTIRDTTWRRDGVVLNLLTGENLKEMDSAIGPIDVTLPCGKCPDSVLRLLSERQLVELVKHPGLRLFDPGGGNPSTGERKHREELEAKQAELEAENERMKREAEESKRQSGGR